MKPRILNLEPEGYSPKALHVLTSFSEVDIGPMTRDELLTNISNYDGLIVRLNHRIDRQILDAAPRLKFIASATTGLNHIDCDYAQKCGISILSLRGEVAFLDSIHATAEHTWALILALIRHIPASTHDVHLGGWNRDAFKGSELSGKTLGIIGYGRLGKKVARYGTAFGMKVLLTDTKRIIPGDEMELVSLEELLTRSEIVSIHVPYNPTTHGFFGREQIQKMRNGSYLINTSRGEVIDETALLESLINGHLAGAALDVMRGENINDVNWINNDPLIRYAKENNNLLITPHLGGCTIESMEKTEVFIAQKIKNFLIKGDCS